VPTAFFLHEFFDVTIAQAVPQIPEDRLKDDALRKMPTMKSFPHLPSTSSTENQNIIAEAGKAANGGSSLRQNRF